MGMGRSMHVHVRASTHTHRHPGGVFAHLEVLRDHGGEVITSTEEESGTNTGQHYTLHCLQTRQRANERSQDLFSRAQAKTLSNVVHSILLVT